jgi:hypothetical protein
MNGQQRGSREQDFSKINPIKSIQELKDYRGYKRILFLRPFANTYMGYLDDEFFGYTVRDQDGVSRWGMEAKEAIDYYLDKTFFHNPSLEWSTFMAKPLYRGYVNALRLKFDKG